MREFAVTDAVPQKNCAPMTTRMSSSAMKRPALYSKMVAHGTTAKAMSE